MSDRADLLLDTSAAVALVQSAHGSHDVVLTRVKGRTLGLAGHAMMETFSVLTRLPGAQRVGAGRAVEIIRHNFPASHALTTRGSLGALDEFRAAGIAGGAVYDGLVALAAREAGIPLLTCDRRALVTYARLGTEVEVV